MSCASWPTASVASTSNSKRSFVPAVAVAAAIFAAIYILLDLNKLWALRYGADTGTFVQFLLREAHGRGSWNGAELRPHLQVHDSWTLLALVPILALFPFAQTLLIVQVIAVAAAAPLVAAFARACGADTRGASVVGIAYLISPSAQGLQRTEQLHREQFRPGFSRLPARFSRTRAPASFGSARHRRNSSWG